MKKFKSNDSLYNISIKDYTKLSILTAKESYNINKSMQLKLADEDTNILKFIKENLFFYVRKIFFIKNLRISRNLIPGDFVSVTM